MTELENEMKLKCLWIRAFVDEGKARLGVVECAKHDLLQPFSVLYEKESESLYQRPIFFLNTFFYLLTNLFVLFFRRVCGSVQVHSAADGQRAFENHQWTFWRRTLQVWTWNKWSWTQGMFQAFLLNELNLKMGSLLYRFVRCVFYYSPWYRVLQVAEHRRRRKRRWGF